MSSEITKYIIAPCDECGHKFRVPMKKSIVLIICPSCKKRYHMEEGALEIAEKYPELFTIEKKKD